MAMLQTASWDSLKHITSIAPAGGYMYLPSLISRVGAHGCCVDPGGWALGDRLAGRESAVVGVLALGAAKEVGGGRAVGTDD